MFWHGSNHVSCGLCDLHFVYCSIFLISRFLVSLVKMAEFVRYGNFAPWPQHLTLCVVSLVPRYCITLTVFSVCLYIVRGDVFVAILHPGDLYLPLGYFYSKSNEGEDRVFQNAGGYWTIAMYLPETNFEHSWLYVNNLLPKLKHRIIHSIAQFMTDWINIFCLLVLFLFFDFDAGVS